jgi:hypothetical protein
LHKNSLRRAVLASITLSSAVAFAACGGDGSAEPPATSAAVPNTAPSTILAPATTPAPTTTEPAAVVTTTQAPTVETTAPMSEEEQAKQAVIEAAEHAWWVFNEAKLDPTNDEKVDAVFDAYTGDARAWIETYLIEQVSANRHSVTLMATPATLAVYPESVSVDLDTGTATADVCEINSNITIEQGGNADGTDRVIDDSITAYHSRQGFELVGDEWQLASSVDIETFDGATACDAYR